MAINVMKKIIIICKILFIFMILSCACLSLHLSYSMYLITHPTPSEDTPTSPYPSGTHDTLYLRLDGIVDLFQSLQNHRKSEATELKKDINNIEMQGKKQQENKQQGTVISTLKKETQGQQVKRWCWIHPTGTHTKSRSH